MEVVSEKDRKINPLYQYGLARFLSGFFYNASEAMMNFLRKMITLVKMRQLYKNEKVFLKAFQLCLHRITINRWIKMRLCSLISKLLNIPVTMSSIL